MTVTYHGHCVNCDTSYDVVVKLSREVAVRAFELTCVNCGERESVTLEPVQETT